MTHTEAPISITAKTPALTLVTIRASNAEELDQVIALTLASLTSAVQELETALRPANTAVPPNPQIAAITTQLGNVEFVQPQQAAPSMGSRMCVHGTMTRIHGLTGKFGPYKGYFCPAKQGDMTKCTTQYVKQSQPEWNTFQADQTKA